MIIIIITIIIVIVGNINGYLINGYINTQVAVYHGCFRHVYHLISLMLAYIYNSYIYIYILIYILIYIYIYVCLYSQSLMFIYPYWVYTELNGYLNTNYILCKWLYQYTHIAI